LSPTLKNNCRPTSRPFDERRIRCGLNWTFYNLASFRNGGRGLGISAGQEALLRINSKLAVKQKIRAKYFPLVAVKEKYAEDLFSWEGEDLKDDIKYSFASFPATLELLYRTNRANGCFYLFAGGGINLFWEKETIKKNAHVEKGYTIEQWDALPIISIGIGKMAFHHSAMVTSEIALNMILFNTKDKNKTLARALNRGYMGSFFEISFLF